MKMITPIKSALLSSALLLAASFTASAANTHTILDGTELAFPSGYDIKEITFTLNADYSLTADIFPTGVPGDTDGDGDPNASSSAIPDAPGVGPSEYLEIDMECGATDQGTGSCIPNVVFIYTNNTLIVSPTDPLVTGLDQYVTFDVLLDRYVLTITDLVAFKAALGMAVTNTVNFGAFSFIASFADGQPDDLVPDNAVCEYVSLDLPMVAQCGLTLTKTSSVSTVGPIIDTMSSQIGEHDDSDSGNDADNSGDSDDSDIDPNTLVCGCKGKVTDLELMYTGAGTVNLDVNRIGPFAADLFDGVVQNGSPFTVTGINFGPKGFKNTLGVAISLSVDGGTPVEIHTSCSEPIGPGFVAGDFVVLSGNSRKLTQPLCALDPTACPLNQQVTYTYTVTNAGTDVTGLVVVDDKMVDPVGGPVSLLAGNNVVFTADACLFETTTNIASASGLLIDSTTCSSNTASVTVDLLLPPEPDPCNGSVDSDSDSGYDNNLNGDSDDSDADSGDTDCDGDSDTMPVTPIAYEGCGPYFWKKNKNLWTTYSAGDRFDSIFGVDAAGNKSLKRTLKGKGAKRQALGRHATAALLNAANPGVNYMYTTGEVISIVVDAYATGNHATATSILKEQNKKGCPINN
ncbi:hypothetical protein MNBD_GAMMA15-1675 [hydrothermal vent metagenome]|uniref:DUF11 domain-containing protein n=1 Tax=hydrothermal vent metagenome TaxID=652676 RepID=A0A3B0YWY7_9ZZZZ